MQCGYLSSFLVMHKVVNRVYHSLYKVGRNGNFVFKGFNNSKKTLPQVGLDLMLQIITGLGVQYQTDELSLHLLVSLRILDPYIVMLY